jgi:hypothetical protein
MSEFERYDEELYALDQRINRLALACGADLTAGDTIVSLIKGDFSACRRDYAPKRNELRALLMLKYHIEEHCVAELGAGECRRIIEAEGQRLRSRGFRISGPPGATTPRNSKATSADPNSQAAGGSGTGLGSPSTKVRP